MLSDLPDPVAVHRPAVSADDPSLVPTLSVMLLLLSFFILLVTMVTFDAGRTKDVLDSLSATFAASPGDTETDADNGGDTPNGVIRRISAEFGVVLGALLRDGTYRIKTSGAVAVVVIDNGELFASGVTPAPALDTLAQRLAALVASTPSALHYEIEAVEPFGEFGATRRAGVVVRALEAAGIAAGSLMAGLDTVEPGKTRIEINVANRQVADAGSETQP